ncbi:trace amine-associated receptor 7c-like [Denticeps clupeoides]|nr:trace amine-associated receptor 7c-like [Denticeps clupeoides]
MYLCLWNANASCSDFRPTTSSVLLFLFEAVVISLTVCGNLVVIISISHFRQLHTPTNFLILSLAVADMLVGMILLPVQFTSTYMCWHLGTELCIFYGMCSLHFTFVSIYNVCLISLDRFYALSHPLLYPNKMTLKLNALLICTNWLVSFAYNLVYFYFSGNFTMDMSVCPGECGFYVDENWSIVDFFFVFVFPCSVITLVYLAIFSIVRKHAKTIRCAREQNRALGGKQGAQHVPGASVTKAAKNLGVLVLFFLMCLLPYFISIVISGDSQKRAMDDAVAATKIVLLLNSTINPIIYALLYPWFQKCVKLIFTLKVCSSDSSLINVLKKN